MSRPAAPVPAGTRFGHFVVIEEAARLTPRERAFRCRLACCGGEVVAPLAQLCNARSRGSKRCRPCGNRASVGRMDPVKGGLARARSRREKQDAIARNQRAAALIRNDIDPGSFLHEINLAHSEPEPCAIESLSDFRRALSADADGLFGAVRARCVGEAA